MLLVLRGLVEKVHRSARSLKERSARALFDAMTRHRKLRMRGIAAHAEFFFVCQKLFSVTRSMFLQFSISIHLHSARLRKWCRMAQAVLLPNSKRQLPVFLLCLVSCCSRAAHTAADLMGTLCTCSAHHAHRMRLSRLLETHQYSDGYG